MQYQHVGQTVDSLEKHAAITIHLELSSGEGHAKANLTQFYGQSSRKS